MPDACYRRRIVTGDGAGIVEVRLDPGGRALLVSCNRPLDRLSDRLQRQFDVLSDPEIIDGLLSTVSLLAPLVAARPGLRVPQAWDMVELAIRAIVGQQVSVAGAIHRSGPHRRADRLGASRCR